jgi:peptide deformylase
MSAYHIGRSLILFVITIKLNSKNKTIVIINPIHKTD